MVQGGLADTCIGSGAKKMPHDVEYEPITRVATNEIVNGYRRFSVTVYPARPLMHVSVFRIEYFDWLLETPSNMQCG
jgi:hypothetical protein